MAGIDTSIYSNLLRAPKSVAEYDAEAQAAEQNRLTLQMGRMKADEYTRGLADQNKLRVVVSQFGADRTANQNMLLKAGRLTEAQKYAKDNVDIDKTAADAGKVKADTSKTMHETAAHQFEIAGQLAASWATNPAVTKQQILSGLSAAAGSGVISPEIAQAKVAELAQLPEAAQALNAWAKGTLQQVMKAKDSMSFITPDANTVASNAQSNANSLRTAASSKYSADSSAASSRYSADSSASTAKANRAQSAEQFGITEKRLKASDKAPTEFQGKSAAFGARAEEADKIITSLNGKYSPAKINSKGAAEGTWLVGGMLGAAANGMLSESDQKAEQAQRDFINAVLRQESGAAIGASEFDNARKQYFPQPNDTPGLLAQKAKNRKLAVDGLKRNAGKAAFSAPAEDDVFSAADAILNGGR